MPVGEVLQTEREEGGACTVRNTEVGQIDPGSVSGDPVPVAVVTRTFGRLLANRGRSRHVVGVHAGIHNGNPDPRPQAALPRLRRVDVAQRLGDAHRLDRARDRAALPAELAVGTNWHERGGPVFRSSNPEPAGLFSKKALRNDIGALAELRHEAGPVDAARNVEDDPVVQMNPVACTPQVEREGRQGVAPDLREQTVEAR
jgi:hypothetical protein